MTTTTTKPGCDKCNKSSLSLLLLRPSPIAKDVRLAPPGSAAVVSDPADTAGILPSHAITQSRYGLRLLRQGYVHIYIANPPPRMKHWIVYRVTADADLVAENNALFSQPDASVVCFTTGHNETGLKLANIPQAHKISDIWIAWSATLWSDALRKQNKANPAVMQQISLRAASPNTFVPTNASLRSKVLECALPTMKVDGNTDHDFPFTSLHASVPRLVDNLQRAAKCHPETTGKEIAVVLRDPVGIAAELNALRLRRNDLIKKDVAKPEVAHPLNSYNTIKTLRDQIVGQSHLESFTQVAPLRTRAAFDAQQWPADTEWHPMSAEEQAKLAASVPAAMVGYKQLFQNAKMGRVIYPDHEARSRKWAHEKAEETWEDIAPFIDEAARRQWVTDFNTRMRTEHFAALDKFETDWRGVSDDATTIAYFSKHFDPDEPNDPLALHCPGGVYSRENFLINAPAPFGTGSALDTYVAMFNKDIRGLDAIALRALMGNQKSWIDTVWTQLTGDSGDTGMRDKTFDVLKELKVVQKYGWMSDAVVFFGVGQLTAASAAVFSIIARSQKGKAAALALSSKLQTLWGVQQGIEHIKSSAVQGAAQGKAPKMPVLITMRLSPDDAMDILDARQGQGTGISRTRIKRMKATNMRVPVTLLTDTDAIRAAGGDLTRLAKDGSAGVAKMGKAATSAAVGSAGPVSVLSEAQFRTLAQDQARRTTVAVNAVRNTLAASSRKGLSAIPSTLDGRLAIGTMVVQAIGIYHALNALEKAADSNAKREAQLGLSDSIAGFMGGTLQMMAVAVEASRTLSAGSAAASKSLGLAGLRIAANFTGVAGGIINAIGLEEKRFAAYKQGDMDVAVAYQVASYAFAGTAVTSAISAVGVGAELLVARQLGGQLARVVAVRVGAGGALGALGLTVSGVGLILLAGGLAWQVGAIVLTPTNLQRWIARSYFGKDKDILFISRGRRDDSFPRGQWDVEFKALEEVMAGKEA